MRASKIVIGTACVLLAAAVVLTPSAALAVSAHAHSHAHSTAGVSTRARWDSGLFSASANAPTTVPGVHSHAWSAASVGFFNINKGGGGHGWWTPGSSPKHYWWHWWVSTGEFVVDGPAGEAPELRVQIVKTGDTNPQVPPNDGEEPKGPTDLNPAPSQGMVAQMTGDVFFDVVVDVEAAGQKVNLFEGGLSLAGPQSSRDPVGVTGDFDNAALRLDKINDRTNVLSLAEEVLGRRTMKVNTGEIFLGDIVATMNVNRDDVHEGQMDVHEDPEIDPTTGEPYSLFDNPEANFGASGHFVVSLALVDQSGRFTLRAVPEPATMSLLALGVVPLLRRRRTRPGA